MAAQQNMDVDLVTSQGLQLKLLFESVTIPDFEKYLKQLIRDSDAWNDNSKPLLLLGMIVYNAHPPKQFVSGALNQYTSLLDRYVKQYQVHLREHAR